LISEESVIAWVCHPERSENFAKRSFHVVEGFLVARRNIAVPDSSSGSEKNNQDGTVEGVGILRLRGTIRFANHSAPLRMTSRFVIGDTDAAARGLRY